MLYWLCVCGHIYSSPTERLAYRSVAPHSLCIVVLLLAVVLQLQHNSWSDIGSTAVGFCRLESSIPHLSWEHATFCFIMHRFVSGGFLSLMNELLMWLCVWTPIYLPDRAISLPVSGSTLTFVTMYCCSRLFCSFSMVSFNVFHIYSSCAQSLF